MRRWESDWYILTVKVLRVGERRTKRLWAATIATLVVKSVIIGYLMRSKHSTLPARSRLRCLIRHFLLLHLSRGQIIAYSSSGKGYGCVRCSTLYKNMKQFLVCRVHILCNVLQLIKYEDIYRYIAQGRPSRHIILNALDTYITQGRHSRHIVRSALDTYITQGRPSIHIVRSALDNMPSLGYWCCTDTSIKSGWVKSLWFFSLKINHPIVRWRFISLFPIRFFWGLYIGD